MGYRGKWRVIERRIESNREKCPHRLECSTQDGSHRTEVSTQVGVFHTGWFTMDESESYRMRVFM